MHGYPTILFLDPAGAVQYKISGYLPAQPFEGEIRTANDAYRNLARYERRLQSNPNDTSTAERAALIYAKREQVDKATPLVQRAEAADPNGEKGPLADAYDALGNYYQSKNDNANASANFEKALKITKDDFIRADATLSLAQVYFGTDKAKAAQYLQDLQGQPNAPDYYKKIADSMLKQLNKSKG